MPAHPDRVRINNGCPYCGENLLDGKHTIDTVSITGSPSYIIGCPKHPKTSPEITFIPPRK